MASIGCPLAGDWLYGEEDPDLIPRPALHAYALDLDHPVTGEHLSLDGAHPGGHGPAGAGAFDGNRVRK